MKCEFKTISSQRRGSHGCRIMPQRPRCWRFITLTISQQGAFPIHPTPTTAAVDEWHYPLSVWLTSVMLRLSHQHKHTSTTSHHFPRAPQSNAFSRVNTSVAVTTTTAATPQWQRRCIYLSLQIVILMNLLPIVIYRWDRAFCASLNDATRNSSVPTK